MTGVLPWGWATPDLALAGPVWLLIVRLARAPRPGQPFTEPEEPTGIGTGTAVIARLENAVRLMQGLRNMGCRFALDDFGRGLSSFACMKNLSVAYLKLHGSFVSNRARDSTDRATVKAINQLGHVLRIEAIADFVTNDAARPPGMDHAQG